MPQEFLRDVVRAGDTARQRHWSVLPLSIAGHAVAVTVLLFSPWAGSIDLPMIASPLANFVETVAPTPPPPPPNPPAPGPTVAPPKAPITAPTGITPDLPTSTAEAPDGAIPNGPGVETGPGVLDPFGTATAVTPPPPLPVPLTPKLVRVGGVIRKPRKILHVAPIYPELARQVRAQGTVTLECILDATGRVESVRVLGSQPLLDDAAVMAVRQWRYAPTELNGVPVPVLMTITIRFSLDR